MAESKAKEILVELRKQLTKIKRDNGYFTDVSRVLFGLPDPTELTGRTLAIDVGDMPLNSLTNDCYRTTGSSAASGDGWQVVIVGYEKHETESRDEYDARLTLLDLHADVIKCISANNRLDLDQVDRIFIGESRFVWDMHENISIFMMLLGVKFTFASSDP